MNFIKAAIVTTCLIIISVVGFIFFSYGSEYQLSLAQEAFHNADYAVSRAALQRLRGDLSPARLSLYHSYLDREEGNLKAAERSLAQARDLLKAHEKREVFFEILLNQGFNAYLNRDLPELEELVSRAESIFPHDAYLSLLKGEAAFLRGDFETAQYLFEKPIMRVAVSNWLKTSFDKYYDPDRISLKIAHCLIEKGNPTLARQIVEGIKNPTSVELQNWRTYLTGLSYVREAQDKSIQAALPYYKLAISYLERLPVDAPGLEAEIQQALLRLNEAMNRFVQNELYRDAVVIAKILKQWQAKEQLETFATRLLQDLEEGIANANWDQVQPLSQALDQLQSSDEARQGLFRIFKGHMTTALAEGHTSRLSQLWESSKAFAPNPKVEGSALGRQLEQHIVEHLPDDTISLELTTPYLTVWQQLVTDGPARLRFAKQLVEISEEMWLRDGGEDRAFRLMSLTPTLVLVADQEALEDHVEASLQRVYASASAQDQMDKLPRLLEAVKHFQITSINLRDKNLAANYLEDAISLYEKGKWEAAAKRAEWILDLFPDSSDARELLARIYFLEGDYARALPHLQAQGDLGSDARQEALSVAEILAGDRAKGLSDLEKLTLSGHKISLENKKRLAFGLLELGDTELAMIWLSTVDQPDPECHVAMAIAYHSQENWEKCLEHVRLVKGPLRELDTLEGLEVLCMVKLGKNEEAADKVEDLLASDSPSPDEEASPALQRLLTVRYGHVNRNYIAGKFFLEVQHQPTTALFYLNKVSPPSAQALLVKSEVLLRARDMEGARGALEAAEGLAIDSSMLAGIQHQLAEIYYQQGRTDQALARVQNLVDQYPQSVNYRKMLVRILKDLHRMDLALQEMVYLRKQLKQDDPDFRIEYLEVLARTDNLEPMTDILREWLERDPDLTLVQRLKIGQLMHLLNNPNMVKAALVSIPTDVAEILPQEAYTVCETYYQVGRLDTALAVAEQFGENFSKHPEGCILLAKLYMALGRKEDALSWSRQATALNPLHPMVLDYLDEQETDAQFLSSLLKQLEASLKESQPSICYKIAAVQHLLNLAVEDLAEKPQTEQLELVRRAARLLDEVRREPFDYPEANFRLGQTQYLLGKPARALELFEATLQRDPSYSKAYKYQAIVAQEQQLSQQAFVAMGKAVSWDPTDAEAWLHYARFSVQRQDFPTAKQSLENAISFRPGFIEAYIQLGQVLIELKNPEDAHRVLSEALAVEANNTRALALMLVCLRDPTVRAGAGPELEEKTLETFQRLVALDPDLADRVRKQLDYEPEERESPSLDLY